MVDDEWLVTAKILGRERDEALAKLDSINDLIKRHLIYQASERGALAREIGRVTGSWDSDFGRETDLRLLGWSARD